MPAPHPQTPTPAPYANEAEGQFAFFRHFSIDADAALRENTDGVHNGNLLEFKTRISDLNRVLFQAVKYLSKLRIRGQDVPAHILLVDLNERTVYRFAASDYDAEIHTVYNTAASRENKGFKRRSEPETVSNYESPAGARTVAGWLKNTDVWPVRITADCVVAWAERYYREVPGSSKTDLLSADAHHLGELRQPRHFAGKVVPYTGDSYAAFAHILDRLNDKLKKTELGAFYTPDAYVKKATELLRRAIARVPEGNDYVIVDRCAGTGNLEKFLTEEELSHVIVNTIEEFEYLELVREFGDRVRAVIPPTHVSGDPHHGLLRNGDALSEAFVLGEPGEVIREHVENPNCTVILFENPPYGEVSGIEKQKTDAGVRFGWRSSWVRFQMTAALKQQQQRRVVGTKVSNDLTNLFIWSAFRYYLRQPTDSYVVFSPTKYFKSQNLVPGKRFMGGVLFNRKHFHTKTGAGVSVVWWANEPEREDDVPGGVRSEYPLDVFDIDKDGKLVAGSVKAEAGTRAPKSLTVKTTSLMLSSLYPTLPEDLETEAGIICELNGYQAHRAARLEPVRAEDIIAYLVAKQFSFENADLNVSLTRAARYDANGTYLTKQNYLKLLPLFTVCRYPAGRRWWERGVVNRCADNGDNFATDAEFLKQCLIYTALSRHNKCLSFTGTDGVSYRNELCFDTGTLASAQLATYELTETETELIEQWNKVLVGARATTGYDKGKSYGLYQIDMELNTSEKRPKPNSSKMETVYHYPVLNGDITTLKAMLETYHADVIAPKLWGYGLLK